MNSRSPQWLKVIYIVIFLALAGYTYWQQSSQPGPADDLAAPPSEQRPPNGEPTQSQGGRNDSDAANSAVDVPVARDAASRYGVPSFPWAEASGSTFTSPQGLIYTMGPGQEHRLQHVFRHLHDQPERSGPHGVFDGDPAQVLALLDQAFQKIQRNDSDVTADRQGERSAYQIKMGRRVGYVGGQTGKRRDHPTATRIKLILEGARVISAYPLWLVRRVGFPLSWYHTRPATIVLPFVQR